MMSAKNQLSMLRVIGMIVLSISFSLKPFAQTEIGIQVYTFEKQFAKDVVGTLDKIKQLGITEMEAGGTYGMSFTDFKKMLDDRGLKVISFGTGYEQLRDDPAAVASDAKKWGATYVACFWIPHHGDEFTIDEMKKAVAVFNAAGKILGENGLSLCYHAHGFEFRPYEQGTLFDYLVKNTNPKWMNFEMDVYWVKNAGQEPLALLKKYPNRFPLMHLKDRKPGTPENQNGKSDPESNVVLGKGDVGIAEIMKVAKKSGVKHYFIEDESSRPEQQVPESLAFLRTLK